MGSGSPAAMVALSDQDQTGTVGTAVAEPPSVRVTDEYGNPVAGVSVTFTTFPQGTVTGSPATTDANGVATVASWTLGTTPTMVITRETLQKVTASVGELKTEFLARAVAGPPASITVRARVPLSAPPKESFKAGEMQTFEATVKDAYGFVVFNKRVDFSLSNLVAASLTGARFDFQGASVLVDMTAGLVAVDQIVEITAFLNESPSISGVATITVLAPRPPNPKPDRFDIPPCQSLGCALTTTVTGNVLADNGSGEDELGDPPGVITRFGGINLIGWIGGGFASVDGWFTVGSTALSPDLSSARQLNLTADGTFTYRGPPGAAFSFQYEVQNADGTGRATVSIVPSASGVSVTTSRPTGVRSNRITTP